MAVPNLPIIEKMNEDLWKETERAGVLRQLLAARRKYRTDWWLAVLSALGLVIFLIIGLFPGLFAPYAYNEEVGPTLLAPGQTPDNYILIARADAGYTGLETIDDQATRASEAPRVGSIDNNASSMVGNLRDLDILVRPIRLQSANQDISPFDALAILNQGDEINALVGSEREFQPLLQEFPDLVVVDYVGERAEGSFLMGTTLLGYDQFSRLVYGTRTTLIIGITSALFAFLIGIPLGLISGFIGGPLDRFLTLIMDSMYSFPGLILAIAIAAVLGPSIGNIILAIAVLYIPTYFRIVRGQTLSVKQALYVEAARSLGASRRETLLKYVFPNVIASVVVIFSVNVADAILTGAGLSFLGLGLPESTPDWGVDLANGQDYLRSAWWLVTFPGLAIALLTLCFSLLGESLSEIFNPRLNKN